MSIFPTIKSRKLASSFLLVMLPLSIALTACGYRGPLYLPNEEAVEPAPTESATGNAPDPSTGDAEEEEEGPGSR